MPKCHWCKDDGDKGEMYCDEKSTGKFNKNGSPKMFRKYFHLNCHEIHLKDQEFKKIEAEKLTNLYDHLLKLHNVIALDGRMMEKIQDLRNGTIKVNNKKVTRYKEGVPYELMLQTYIQFESKIDEILRTMHFNEKWNEFSYILGVVARGVNDVMIMNTRHKKYNEEVKSSHTDDVEIQVLSKSKKSKDSLDISEFL